MRAHLQTPLTVHHVEVFAEMAWIERRPELGLLCRAAREREQLTPAVVQEVLPGLSETGAQNVVAWCQHLGLCGRRGELRPLAENVAVSDEAPVPEQGVYGLWLARHPVLGSRILSVERRSHRKNMRVDQIQPLPLTPDRDTIFCSVVEPTERFLLRGLPGDVGDANGQLCGVQEETAATCDLHWRLDFDEERDTWWLSGEIEVPQREQREQRERRGKARNGGRARQSMRFAEESAGLTLSAVAGAWGRGPLRDFGVWEPRERRLAVSFATVDEGSVDTFLAAYTLAQAEIHDFGVFYDVRLEDVPLRPATADDAQAWAMARFNRRIDKKPSYRSRADVRQIFARVVEETPLERFSPTLPSHEELLAEAGRAGNLDRFWSLAAPVDLAPYPVSAEELGPMQIVDGAASEVEALPDVVRVPYRSVLSMRALVARLLGGATPKRALLCDRFVRGQANLDTLGLLAESLRVLGLRAPLEVLTEGKKDSAAIQAVAGTPPRSYQSVFKAKGPHDRYLLIETNDGAAFAWQLSNSLLHGRAGADIEHPDADAPLRWRDLVGIRVDDAQLAPALGAWFTKRGSQ